MKRNRECVSGIQGGYRFNSPGKEQLVNAVGKEFTHLRSFVRDGPWRLNRPEYRRAHCCCNVASIALVRLMAGLEDQSEFTQIAYFGAEKGGGLAGVEGRDALQLARTSS